MGGRGEIEVILRKRVTQITVMGRQEHGRRSERPGALESAKGRINSGFGFWFKTTGKGKMGFLRVSRGVRRPG